MRLKLLRNALLKLNYAGKTLLIDPDLGDKLSRRSIAGKSQNPMVDLPEPIEDILAGVDHLIVSHLHSDHFDEIAKAKIAKDIPLICQPGNEEVIRQAGFTRVTPLDHFARIGPIVIKRQPAQHGTGPVVEVMGPVMGLTLEAPGEPTVYWCGDSVLYPPLQEAVARAEPDVIVTHSCGALWDGTLIVMDAQQTLDLAEAHPRAVIVATHMEALDHASVSRQALREAAEARGISSERLLIPADGETVELKAPARAGA